MPQFCALPTIFVSLCSAVNQVACFWPSKFDWQVDDADDDQDDDHELEGEEEAKAAEFSMRFGGEREKNRSKRSSKFSEKCEKMFFFTIRLIRTSFHPCLAEIRCPAACKNRKS